MSSSLQEQQQQALDEFRKQRQALVDARKEIRAISVTARSRDGVVEVTVGHDGAPSGLRFPNNKFKEMTGQALAASVLEAMTASRAQMTSRAMAVIQAAGGTAPTGLDGGVLDRVDLDRLLDGGSLEEVLKPRRPGGDSRG
ncbi:YbaB/EbfC family nucleoid-associated protein [Streptomyces humi]|uniref:YbaB/EbfC family nucleoid-associated protein n=1 Tax=Streptomyces humi TaxID=1428620 RepID=UPI000628809B|nr:YbaB/EbfC family nucleoid-associated protein [Streptomyces humi]